MDNQTISKIVETLCAVAERTEMSKDEEEYYDMAIGFISLMSEEQKQNRRTPYSHEATFNGHNLHGSKFVQVT